MKVCCSHISPRICSLSRLRRFVTAEKHVPLFDFDPLPFDSHFYFYVMSLTQRRTLIKRYNYTLKFILKFPTIASAPRLVLSAMALPKTSSEFLLVDDWFCTTDSEIEMPFSCAIGSPDIFFVSRYLRFHNMTGYMYRSIEIGYLHFQIDTPYHHMTQLHHLEELIQFHCRG